MTQRVVCVIPARAGSKRLPQKNIKDLHGKPLIVHSIEHAQACDQIEQVIVSTDSEEIAHIARQAGAQVVIRPDHLADDQATSESALLHALDQLQEDPDVVVFLQCTSPIRSKQDVTQALAQFYKDDADSLLSATKNTRFLWKKQNNNFASLNYDYRHRQREQDLDPEYQENGSIYICKTSLLRDSQNRLGGQISIYPMDYWASFQIDDPEDFELCEWILSRQDQQESDFDFSQIKLVVSDFDGVLTNNKVIVNQEGLEFVECNRGDGWGVNLIKDLGIPFVVLSTEKNPVVARRCEKMGVECYHGVSDKLALLNEICEKQGVALKNVVYIGNDTNDFECLKAVGCGVVVSDAAEEVINLGQIVLHKKGGDGAIRELATRMKKQISKG